MKIEVETTYVFPVVVLEICQSDIREALGTFEEDVRDELVKIVWNELLAKKLAEKLHKRVIEYYYDCALLPNAIREVLKDEIAEIKEKEKFLGGIRKFLKSKGKEKK